MLDVTEFIDERPEMYFRTCPLVEIANPISLLQKGVDTADDVYALGHPVGLAQGSTVLPLARKGILASSPRRALIEGNAGRDGFLIDGAVIHGSSGSPVICAIEFFRAGDLETTPHRAILLGIIVEEWYRRSDECNRRSDVEYAHLGFAQNTLTIMQTILEFGAVSASDFLASDHDAYWNAELGINEWSIDIYAPTVDAQAAADIMYELRQKRLVQSGSRIAVARHIADNEFGFHAEQNGG